MTLNLFVILAAAPSCFSSSSSLFFPLVLFELFDRLKPPYVGVCRPNGNQGIQGRWNVGQDSGTRQASTALAYPAEGLLLGEAPAPGKRFPEERPRCAVPHGVLPSP